MLRLEDFPLLCELYALLERQAGGSGVFTDETLRELRLHLHSLCVGPDSLYFNGHTNIGSGRFVTFGVISLLEAGQNLRDAMLGTNVDESLRGDEERALLDAGAAAEGKVAEHLAGNEYAAALAELANLRAPIDAFFDGVMVMDENEALRENRLRLLNRFVAEFKGVADFG